MSQGAEDKRWREPAPAGSSSGDQAVLLASRRTRLSFQRTRMSADRTLMSVVRTSLSLIGFGFTIFQFFRALRDAGVSVRALAPRNFGLALVALGVLLLILGIGGHVRFMLELRRDHTSLVEGDMLPADQFPFSVALAVAILLLMTGLLAIASMVLRRGPFG